MLKLYSPARPVSSGWKPVPTSSRLATRPLMVTRPVVGSVIRLKIFNSVLFPAPLRPMMPTASPRRISKLTSLSAHTSSHVSPCMTGFPWEIGGHDAASCPPISLCQGFGLVPERSRVLHQHVAQSKIGAIFRLVADDIFFTEVFSFDNDVGHEKPVKSEKEIVKKERIYLRALARPKSILEISVILDIISLCLSLAM